MIAARDPSVQVLTAERIARRTGQLLSAIGTALASIVQALGKERATTRLSKLVAAPSGRKGL